MLAAELIALLLACIYPSWLLRGYKWAECSNTNIKNAFLAASILINVGILVTLSTSFFTILLLF